MIKIRSSILWIFLRKLIVSIRRKMRFGTHGRLIFLIHFYFLTFRDMMLTKLRKNVQLELKKPEPLADELLFVRAINEVSISILTIHKFKFINIFSFQSFIYVLMVTFNQYMDFLRIMIEVTPDDTVVSSFKTRHYNAPDIESR